jgi:hypothetical protein
LDSLPFDLLYVNIKARANSSVSKPPSDPRWGPAIHRLDVVDILSGKSFPVDFIPGNERFLVNFILAIAAKDNQIHLHRGGINRRDGDEIGCRSSPGSSSFCKDETGVDVSAGRAFSTTGASRTPKGNNAGNEDDDDEDPPLDGAAVIAALEGLASDERGTLRT